MKQLLIALVLSAVCIAAVGQDYPAPPFDEIQRRWINERTLSSSIFDEIVVTTNQLRLNDYLLRTSAFQENSFIINAPSGDLVVPLGTNVLRDCLLAIANEHGLLISSGFGGYHFVENNSQVGQLGPMPHLDEAARRWINERTLSLPVFDEVVSTTNQLRLVDYLDLTSVSEHYGYVVNTPFAVPLVPPSTNTIRDCLLAVTEKCDLLITVGLGGFHFEQCPDAEQAPKQTGTQEKPEVQNERQAKP
jgi:hypothetical protein